MLKKKSESYAVGSSKIYELNKNIFELQTKQKKPYYTFNNSNEQIQYAVCPACDNPIQIIGLYKKLKNTDKPYGRHCIHSVAGLAEYNQQAYDFCPYSKKSFNVNPQSRKGKLTDLEKNIYYLLRDQFDRVIYILRQVLDIYITNKSAKSMLETFVKGKCYYCKGTGSVQKINPHPYPNDTCPICKGNGVCPYCNGTGKVDE